MKTAILFWLVMTAPDGNQFVMDSGLTADDCAAMAAPGEIVSYYDDRTDSTYPVPAGARMTCEAMGQEV